MSVPRKNVRSIAGFPIAEWAIQKMQQLVSQAFEALDEPIAVVIATDSEELLARAEMHVQFANSMNIAPWLSYLPRPPVDGDQTIADFLLWATETHETMQTFDWIGVHQLTSPTLKAQTMFDVVKEFLEEPELGSIQTMTLDSSFRWSERYGMDPQSRTNRQYRDPADQRWAETGGLHLVRGFPWSGTTGPMISPTHRFFEVPAEEAIDIDTSHDWAAAESVLDRPRIALICTGNHEMGSGHLRRTVAVAQSLSVHADVAILPWKTPADLREAASIGSPNIHTDDLGDVFEHYDAVVLDTLDLLDVREHTAEHPGKTVSIESFRTDPFAQPINGLYSFPPGTSGPDWVDIRDEFRMLPPFVVHENVRKVTVSMGGTDAANLSAAICNALRCMPELDGVIVTLIAPPASAIDPSELPPVEIVEQPNMALEFYTSDILITSRGRTQFEAAHVGVPTIALPVNKRERYEHISPAGVRVCAPGGNTFDLVDSIEMLPDMVRALLDSEVRFTTSQTEQEAVDGHGLDRIVEQILIRAREQRRRRAPISLGG